jgi:hypothetical protein
MMLLLISNMGGILPENNAYGSKEEMFWNNWVNAFWYAIGGILKLFACSLIENSVRAFNMHVLLQHIYKN